MYLGGNFRVDDPQGLAATKIKEEEDTTTWRDDALLTLFAVNSGSGQIVYNIKLLKPGIFGSKGTGIGQFNRPHGIACNPDGDVYVADTDNNRLVRLRYTQGKLTWVAVVDSGLGHPYDVTINSRGEIYLTDTDSNRVIVYQPRWHQDSDIFAPGWNVPVPLRYLTGTNNSTNSDLTCSRW